MRRLLAFALLAALVLAVAGCGSNEMTNEDQAARQHILHNAEKESQAKDGIKGE